MTEADIYPLLSELAMGNVFPYVAPQNTTAPWVVFILPSATFDDVLCGQSGASANTLQIDVYAHTIDEAREIRTLARDALKPLNPANLNELNDYEGDTALYRATLEVQLWS
ncbi:tail completion protein gp17 [Mixta calida]|uniref:tail completion protein gp17 n=1 Tax=Mixta calida TaxID=665913 RepID=UPI003CE9BA17